MTPSVTGTGTTTDSTATGSTGLSKTQVDKNMFLQLLVAQLKNQDPLNPADGTEFVGQLAQFQQMESTLNMGQDLAAIRETLNLISAGINPETAA
jgi:flagellar basal-body rod modification protein FlgD